MTFHTVKVHLVKPAALKNPNVVDLVPKLWAINLAFNLGTLNLATTLTPVVIKRDLNISQQHLMFPTSQRGPPWTRVATQILLTVRLCGLSATPSHWTIRTFMSSFLAISFSTLLWVQPKFQAGSWRVCTAWHLHQHQWGSPAEDFSPNSNKRVAPTRPQPLQI